MNNRLYFVVLVAQLALSATAQDVPFAPVSVSELARNTYENDTSAGAVVLKEFGEAYISNGENYHLMFTYRARIKILNKKGLEQADVEIALRKFSSSSIEKIVSL